MNQTNGGMQPWHQMQKQNPVDNDSDDGIFKRHKEENEELHSADDIQEERQHPAILDGGILLLDAQEAVQSIIDDDSNRMVPREASALTQHFGPGSSK